MKIDRNEKMPGEEGLPESPDFRGRLQAVGEVAGWIARMREAQLANPGGDRLPIPLNFYLLNLARKSRLPWESLAAYFHIPDAGSVTVDSIRGWSEIARYVRLPLEDARRQLFCTVLEQQGRPEAAALRGSAFGGDTTNRREALDQLRATMLQERRFTIAQETELQHLETELEKVYPRIVDE
jgi:hypothetical protein